MFHSIISIYIGNFDDFTNSGCHHTPTRCRYWKNDGSGGILETFMNRLIIVLVILALSAPVWGDGNDAYASASEWFGVDPNAGRNSFLILSIPSGGKYEGMATAHTAMALDGGYIESNPAAGSFLPRTILSFSHVDWIADSGLETITYTFRPEKNEDSVWDSVRNYSMCLSQVTTIGVHNTTGMDRPLSGGIPNSSPHRLFHTIF